MLRKKRFEEQMLAKVDQQLENIDQLVIASWPCLFILWLTFSLRFSVDEFGIHSDRTGSYFQTQSWKRLPQKAARREWHS